LTAPANGHHRSFPRLSGWGWLIVVTTLLALGTAFFEPDNDVDEAVAAVAAAVIALAGTFAGHKAGHAGTRRNPGPPASTCQRLGERLASNPWGAGLIAFILVLLTAIVGIAAYFVVQELVGSISPAAAAAILAATAGVAATRVAHERWLSLAEHIAVGRTLFSCTLIATAVLVIGKHQSNWPLNISIRPPDIAAFAASVIGVAGTFLAHSASRQNSRFERRPTATVSGSLQDGGSKPPTPPESAPDLPEGHSQH
jgi:hypothetical protein